MKRPKLSVAATLGFATLLGLMILSPWANSPRAETDANEQGLWSPYWTVEPGFTSTLEMKNNRAVETLTVNVSLYFASGEEYYLDPLQVAPRQTVVLNLNHIYDALPPAVAARAGREGTLEVEFNAENHAALMGSVSVTNPEQGIAWNFRLYPRADELPVVPVRGLFWFFDNDTDGFVAIQNVSEDFISVTPAFQIESQSHPLAPISLAPGRGYKLMLRVALQSLDLANANSGGVELTYQGPPDAVKAHGVLFNRHGFSTEVDFHRFDQWPEPRTAALRTPRFALGPADPRLGLPAPTVFTPYLLLHNFSAHPLALNLSLGAPSERQFPLTLSPGENRVVPLASLLGEGAGEGSHWGWLELSYSDRHNGLIAALVSVTQEGAHSLRSVLNWVQGSASDGWYWRADATHNTLIGILNADTEEARVQVSLDYYSGGLKRSYEMPELTIAPRSSHRVDIGAVIASGLPDPDGDLIPAGVATGGYRVQKVGPRLGKVLITEALVIDRQRKNFESIYNTCCALTNIKALPNALLIPFQNSGQINVTALDLCTFQTVTVTESADFFSSNSAVADVGQGGGVVFGAGVGTATVNTALEYFEWSCAPANFDKDTGTDVNPTVTVSCDKQHLALGPTAPASTKTGSCTTTASPAGGAYSWSVNKTTVTLSPSGGSASYTAASESTGTGDTVITVTYTVNNRLASAQSAPITVRKPTDLFVESDTTNPTGKTCNVTCLNGSPGCSYQSYLRTRTYVVRDQLNQLFPTVGIDPIDGQESFSGFSSTCGASPPATGSSPVSRFPDEFFFCAPNCLPGGPGCTASATQSITVNGLPVRTVSVNWSCIGVTLVP